MLQQETLDFLKELEKNNNRDWFQANKARFDAAQDNLTALTGYLIGKIAEFDDAVAAVHPKTCLFRIYRDIRFSADKTPYKTNLGAYINPGGRKSMRPGYYLHIQPDQSFVAGGKHLPDGPETLKIRTAIGENTAEFLAVVKKASYHQAFGEMRGDKLKTVPKGFDAAHKAIEYLRLKEFMAFQELHDEAFLTSVEFPAYLVKTMKEMYPLVGFLRKALAA